MIATARVPTSTRAEQNPAYRLARLFSITYCKLYRCLTTLPDRGPDYLTTALSRQFSSFLNTNAAIHLVLCGIVIDSMFFSRSYHSNKLRCSGSR